MKLSRYTYKWQSPDIYKNCPFIRTKRDDLWIRQSVSLDLYEKDWMKMKRMVHNHKVFLSSSSGFSLFDSVFFVFLINYMGWQTQWWKRYQCKFSDNQVCDTLNLGIFHFAPISIIQILSCFCMCHLRSHLNPTFLATYRSCLNLRGCFLKWDIFVY